MFLSITNWEMTPGGELPSVQIESEALRIVFSQINDLIN